MKFRIRKQDVEALCRQVPEFETVVRQTKLTSFECVRDLFAALVRSIVAQQLSVKAADAITVRLEKLLRSAIANWEAKNENERLEDAKLCVKEIFVDGGRMLKRVQPAPQGLTIEDWNENRPAYTRDRSKLHKNPSSFLP